MEYVENINVSTIIEKRKQYVDARAELEKRLSQLHQEIEQVKNNIHAYAGAVSA